MFVTLLVLVTLTLQKCVYGQDGNLQADKEGVPTYIEENNRTKSLEKESDLEGPLSKGVPDAAEPEDSVPEVKGGFPPYNYTPAETTAQFDYDLDATPLPAVIAKAPGEAMTTLWRKLYKQDKNLDYLLYLGMVVLFGLGVLLGRYTIE